jgi:NADH-quinone oxidoreductase subunit L
MMALSGVPLFFAGAWTKEEILHATAHWPASALPNYLMMLGVVLTALYMTRQMIFVFFGNSRAAPAHESPRVMTLPLIALSIATVLLSIILTPGWPWLRAYLSGEAPAFDLPRIVQPMLFVSLALVAVGIGLGVLIYRNSGDTDPLAQHQRGLFTFLENRMWIDELYAHTVIAFSRAAALFSDWMDRHFWDGLVRSIGATGQLFGIATKGVDERAINAGVDDATVSTRAAGRLMSVAHSGQIQRYLGAVGIGMLALLLLYAWLT